ncbi:type II secretion system protein N (GspN) [Eoetvoesiella caeni]|uniref:Type II secretion system protein N n=1 Tax=Eoetvoesiella caeni TaxID=645616 RepID=A0A366H9D0_9BURK|nr:type II secretion system protein N (GspN) [Eoetvoesiella caeni]
MNRRVIFSVAGLILLACCAALAVLPARWIMAMLPTAWPLAVVNASGTVWSGSATLAIGTASHRRTIAEPLRWHLSIADGPKLLVSHPWLGGPLAVTPAWLGLAVSGQTLQLPAPVLATLDARIAAVGPGGELLLQWPATVIGRSSRPPGTTLLNVQWRNAASALAPIRPLGDYALILKQADQGRADVVLSTRQGPLMLNGTGILDRKGGFQFDGTAQTDPTASTDTHAVLRDLLATLGPHRNNQTLLRFR